jgi:hypothetical protein
MEAVVQVAELIAEGADIGAELDRAEELHALGLDDGTWDEAYERNHELMRDTLVLIAEGQVDPVETARIAIGAAA